jgi:hypothetical protein
MDAWVIKEEWNQMAKTKKIYRLKVTLRYSRPPIWRRLKVYDDVTLYELHQILQVAMGWENSHLHMFRQGRTFFGEPDTEFGPDCIDEARTRLREVLLVPKNKLTYDYDFGDSWEHQVVLEAIEDPDPNETYPMVVAGKRACPPEDVGGVPGYEEFLDAMADPNHPGHEDMRDWYGQPFDPNAFNLKAINLVFQPAGGKKRGSRT